MSKISLPHDSFVFVGDGRKALFLRNAGDEKFMNLKVEESFDHENPPTHEQGSDRPGRVLTQATTHRHAAVEATDWHDIEEHRFARRVAAAFETIVRDRHPKAIVIAAPARTLAELRSAFHADTEKRIVAEIVKDLTKLPIGEIEKHLTS